MTVSAMWLHVIDNIMSPLKDITSPITEGTTSPLRDSVSWKTPSYLPWERASYLPSGTATPVQLQCSISVTSAAVVVMPLFKALLKEIWILHLLMHWSAKLENISKKKYLYYILKGESKHDSVVAEKNTANIANWLTGRKRSNNANKKTRYPACNSTSGVP